jgi:phosphoribosylformimino-5-aminoimidazole carboxamide ribotide isomerase
MWFDLPIEVVPAVDVLDDEAVRLERGEFTQVVERAADPVALARAFVEAGARRIHLVDLEGARNGGVRPQLVERVASLGVRVQVSGGIRSARDARTLLDAGADRIVVGTAAWPDPTPWLDFGDALLIAVDVRDGIVQSTGWTQSTGIALDTALERSGGARILLTAIDRDGTLAGPDLELVAAAAANGSRVVAAGGVRSPQDARALQAAGAEAVVVGRALLYFLKRA